MISGVFRTDKHAAIAGALLFHCVRQIFLRGYQVLPVTVPLRRLFYKAMACDAGDDLEQAFHILLKEIDTLPLTVYLCLNI